jgi:uncharacterized membrane protein YdfJ with MMPL/SSD domain
MSPHGFTGRWAAHCARHPWRTYIAWLAVIVVVVGAALTVGGTYIQDEKLRIEFESTRADDLIDQRIHNGVEPPLEEWVIVESTEFSVDDPEFQSVATELEGEIQGLDTIVAGTASYFNTGNESLVSADRHKTMMIVSFSGAPDDAIDNAGPFLDFIAERRDAKPGFTVLTIGNASMTELFNQLAEDTLVRGELIGVSIALIVLVLVFGSLVAAGLPILMAVISILVSLMLSLVIANVTDISFFIANMITMIGLAVGIDYVLFIVSRFREERERDQEIVDAIVRTGETSGKAILFSGLTVVVALVSLLIVPHSTFFSLGLGAIIVVIVSLLMIMTLLPATLRLLGDRVNMGRLPVIGYGKRRRNRQEGFWAKTARTVMRRPVVSAGLACLILIALGSVAFSLKLGATGINSVPEDTDVFIAFSILERDFLGEDVQPAVIVVDAADITAPQVQQAVDGLIARIGEDDFFGPATITDIAESNNLIVIEAPLTDDAQSNAAFDAIKRLRNDYIPPLFDSVPAEAEVTGQTASTVDFAGMVAGFLPLVFAFVLAITFVLLLIAFRSIVIPIKAIIMNLLSVFAAYGLLTLVFQHGVGADLFGFKQVDRIESWIPLFLFAVLFGLSMDYHIFLLSRIKEHYDLTHRNRDSVAEGLRSTASIITGAALIMVGVFGGFALGDLAPFQQMGFGLAVAVVLDATLIRSVLVPASMALLGDWNWYMPRWLGWLPHLSIEGTPGGSDLEGSVAD